MFLFSRKTQAAPVQTQIHIEVIRRDPCELRVHEWKVDNTLVKEAREVLSNPTFRLMLDAVRNDHPSLTDIFPPNTPENVRACQHSLGEGYSLALAKLQSLGVLTPPPTELEADFQPETVKTTK